MACGCGTCAACLAAQEPVPTVPRARNLVERLSPRLDRIRQRTLVRFGLRPYEVFLVWTRWDGEERGEGQKETQLASVRIVPRPKVVDLTTLSLSPFAAGILPVGSVRLEAVTTSLTEDNLLGNAVPSASYLDSCGLPRAGRLQSAPGALQLRPGDVVGKAFPRLDPSGPPRNVDFFYEIVEDRSGSERKKFRPFSTPTRRGDKFDWTIVLERVSEDRRRSGETRSEHEASED